MCVRVCMYMYVCYARMYVRCVRMYVCVSNVLHVCTFSSMYVKVCGLCLSVMYICYVCLCMICCVIWVGVACIL